MSEPRWHRWRDWPLGAKSAAAVLVPMALLLVGLVFSFRQQQAISTADADVRRALVIQAEIKALHSLIAESATAVRGYLLTGRDEFLAPYRNAQQELPVTLTNLRRNIRDPEMKSRLEHIQDLLQAKLDSLDELRDHGRTLPPAELQAHLLGSKGVLDELRAEVRAMDTREADLVAGYSAQARLALLRNLWVDGVTSVLVLATGIGAFLLLFSGVVRRVQQLASNAERLARGEPLEALPEGRDELGQLADRLQNASLLLASRADEARAASIAKTQFLSRTSHELRTPLNAILGFAQLLDDDLAHTPQHKSVGHILNAGRHLLTLINELLEIARIEARHLTLTPSRVSVVTLLEDTQALMAAFAAEHGIVIEPVVGDASLSVWADRARLLQVLLNLYSNAIKYNRHGGWVRVTVARDGESIHITVTDSGPGIDPAMQHRLFQPFDRLGAETQGIEGLGLGLAISRQLMAAMGGDLSVRSRLGEGSAFSLQLSATPVPQVLPQCAVPAVAMQPQSVPPPVSRSLLCIEDNASNLALIEALMARRPQWRLSIASSGHQGLEMACAQAHDLILLDLHLPDLSGEAVLTALRDDPALCRVPVVILSADALPETRQRLLAQGVADYLTKPLDVRRFLALLDRKPT